MVPDHSIRISADRGGLLRRLRVRWIQHVLALVIYLINSNYVDPDNPPHRKELVVKLLSQDPANYKDAPTEGIRVGERLDITKIGVLYRLSTTVATNALLERKGRKHALLITKGFKDLLLIGNQSRPKIFDLNIRRPPPLYSTVVEINERVTLVGYTSDPQAEEHKVIFDEDGQIKRGYRGKGWDQKGDAEGPGRIVQGISGEAVRILKEPDETTIRADLQKLYDDGYRSVAVVLAHSYTFPEHELLVGKVASSLGFEHISLSSQLLPMIKMFMSSDGGLVDTTRFTGLKTILSGPAGGVVGYARTSWDERRKTPIIGLDVGGTSTDVSRFSGRYEVVYETTTAGVTIQSPQLDINTVAAGGGSCLTFRNGLFLAGPESAGAEPGPACYRKGGPLAVTDANLLLGRLVPKYFPKIFGKAENEPLDEDASRREFEKLAQNINEKSANDLSLDEIIYGFIKVANETMCRPIRSLTEAKGYATSSHILASFGGAGGQHACEIASLLGIKTILIHRYSSILSAYGLALADRVHEIQEPASTFYTAENESTLFSRLDTLTDATRNELEKQGFAPERIRIERMLNMRFNGTDTALMVLPEPGEGEDYLSAFRRAYKAEFGFLLDEARVVVDDIKVRGVGTTTDKPGQRTRVVVAESAATRHSVYFDKIGRVDDTPVFELDKMAVGDAVDGPAVVIDDTQTIVVVPGARATLASRHVVITL
ncbi:Hydantoinase/oxoprolinase-domain-containing protein [Russula vinacea]|nr:Hydantoinase/oxoprolinase-domain-containing protein [Russula vinacea]